MSTGISTLDNATQDVNIWLKSIDEEMDWDDRNRSFRLLRSVLHALRDMLGVDEAADLAAQMPLLIRGVYFEGWNPSATPAHDRSLDAFIARIQHDFRGDPLARPELAIAAVFKVLGMHITSGEIEQVRMALRKDIREIWAA